MDRRGAPVAAIERIARVRGAAAPAADASSPTGVIADASPPPPPPVRASASRTASCATAGGSVTAAASATADDSVPAAAAATADDSRSTAATTSTAATVSRPVASIGAAGVTTEDRQADPPPGDTMTLTEHLGELRVRIIRSALAITIGMVLVVAFYDQVLEFLLAAVPGPVRVEAPRFLSTSELFNFTPTEGLSDAASGRHVRRHHPGPPGHPVAGLAVHRAGAERQGEEVRHPVHRVVGRAVRRRRLTRLPHDRAGARVPHLLGRRRRQPGVSR